MTCRRRFFPGAGTDRFVAHIPPPFMDNGRIRENPSAEEWALGDPIPFRGRIRDGAEPAAFEIPAAVVPGIARICSLGLGMGELLGEACRVLVAADILSLPPDDPVRVLHEPHSVRSLLLAPLKFGTGLVGLLALHGYGAPRKWEEEDSRIAGSVASILSAALERRRVEERLRVSEARYRFLADHALDFISLIDASGKVLFASPSAHRMLGYRPARGPPGSPLGSSGSRGTSRSETRWKAASSRARKWRRSGCWRGGWPTNSTICSWGSPGRRKCSPCCSRGTQGRGGLA